VVLRPPLAQHDATCQASCVYVAVALEGLGRAHGAACCYGRGPVTECSAIETDFASAQSDPYCVLGAVASVRVMSPAALCVCHVGMRYVAGPTYRSAGVDFRDQGRCTHVACTRLIQAFVLYAMLVLHGDARSDLLHGACMHHVCVCVCALACVRVCVLKVCL
jgi:hypothetical protein